MEQSAANEIWSKVLMLPVKYREVLILDAKYELTTKEIAGVLGLAEGTVKSRLHRARQKMSELRRGGYVSVRE
jgi:RNA polymerase sigma-70 factor (ECF subfamily)